MLDNTLSSLESLERRAAKLSDKAATRTEDFIKFKEDLKDVESFLELAPQAQLKLEDLSKSLFRELLDELETNLTHAIREILEQDREVKAEASVKGKKLQVDFHILNNDSAEDILRGQGGSVCNILSVGLRLIALSRLNPSEHRPFLVLDEQDCWLRPNLVPKFMSLISTIANSLGFQVLVISHHPLDLFAESADNVLVLSPSKEGKVRVESKIEA